MNLHRLDAADPEARTQFERAFYEAFARAKANRLARRLYDWQDEQRRIRPHIPYADQIILVVCGEDGQVDTAAAINRGLTQYQAARLGFQAPPRDLRHHCEILVLFSRLDAALGELRTFLSRSAELLLQEGLRSADATCTDRLLPVYAHIGGQPLAECTLEGEHRTLLRFQLQEMAHLHELT